MFRGDDEEESGVLPSELLWNAPYMPSRSLFTRQSTEEINNIAKKNEKDGDEPREDGGPSNRGVSAEETEMRRKKSSWRDLIPEPSSSLRKRKDQKVVGLKNVIRKRSNTEKISVEEEEKFVRSKGVRNAFVLMLTGILAALKIFVYYLVTIETMMVLALTIGLTLYWYFKYVDEPEWGASNMDWFIVGFAVVGPMSASLTMTFNRREAALQRLSQVRSFAYHIYIGHALWDWDDGRGRENCKDVDWLDHTDSVMAQLIGIADELSRFLTLPSATRSRHRMTVSGRKDAAEIMNVAYKLFDSLSTQRMTRLTKYAENLKSAGLGASEISRIRQYERWLGEAIEALRQYKLYRTPQALRSFARIFTIALPPFYAPTFAALAIEVRSLGVGLFMGIFVTLALMALFQSIQVLEDPFIAYVTLDGIDVREELEVLFWQQLVDTRHMLFPDAPNYPESPREALTPGGTIGISKIEVAGKQGDQDSELGSLRKGSHTSHHRLKSFELPNFQDIGMGNESISSDDGHTRIKKSRHRIRLHTAEGPQAL